MLKKVLSGQASILSVLTVLLSLTALSVSQPVLMTEEVGALIFQEHQYFLIYVYDQGTPEVIQTFNQYCKERTNCAILNQTVEEYSQVRRFIGKNSKEFFLILNVPFEKKYVLDVDTKTMTANDLANFQKRYEDGTFEPFFASEHIPTQASQFYTQIVGRTFDDFLKEPAVIKVVYTYTKHEKCGGCIPLLKDFMGLAEKVHNKNVVIFGFVDVFLNDISKIPQPIVPHFYIYQGDQIVKEVDQASWEELPEILKKEVGRVMIDIGNHIDVDDDSSNSDNSSQSL